MTDNSNRARDITTTTAAVATCQLVNCETSNVACREYANADTALTIGHSSLKQVDTSCNNNGSVSNPLLGTTWFQRVKRACLPLGLFANRCTSLVGPLIGMMLFIIGIRMFITIPPSNSGVDKDALVSLRAQMNTGNYDLQLLNTLIEKQRPTGLFDIYTDLYARPINTTDGTRNNNNDNNNDYIKEQESSADKRATFNYLMAIYETRLRADRFAYQFKCTIGWIMIVIGVMAMFAQAWFDWMCSPSDGDDNYHERLCMTCDHTDPFRLLSSSDDNIRDKPAVISNEESGNSSSNTGKCVNSSSITTSGHITDTIVIMPISVEHDDAQTQDTCTRTNQPSANEATRLIVESSSRQHRSLPEPRPICATLGTGITWTPACLHNLNHTTDPM
ncbi:hypothetical protein BDF22DRAFT_683652 [Syncephalis plumigaleata]|nr:hypothetical protein BDF22DRAFT_683652 [Syncephalis plumigaleata]